MLNSGTNNLDLILNSGQNGISKYGIGFDASMQSAMSTFEVRLFPASVKTDQTGITVITNIPVKSFRMICYYYGRKGHVRSCCYKLIRDRRYQ